MNNVPTFFLIKKLNEMDKIDDHRYYTEFQAELESRQPATQLYFGEPDGEAIILPFELFDENGYEIIEPVTYNNYGEPIWWS